MCLTNELCGKKIKTFVNVFGDEETQTCVKNNGHKGRCSYKWTHMLNDVEGYDKGDLKSLADKIDKSSYMTNGETAHNSPIVNRTTRFLAQNENGEKLIPVTGEEKRLLKEEGKFRIAVRKDELSTFTDCQKIEKDLVDEVMKVLCCLSSHCCFFCLEEFTVDDFIGKNRKDPNAAQHGHINPLSDKEVRHLSGNVSWIHRECNLIQSDSSLMEKHKKLKKIVEKKQKMYGF